MTLDEFKAWFEGFTESMESRPTEKQWTRIKQQVKKIDGAVTTYPIFVDRYIPHYPTYWRDRITCGGYGIGLGSLISGNTDLKAISSSDPSVGISEAETLQGGLWNSAAAFKGLGLEDFRAVQ